MPGTRLYSSPGATGEPELILAGPFDPARIRAILLDIEGTTTPVEFVYEVLFPYARAHLESFLRRNRERADVRVDLEALRREHASQAQRTADLPAWRGNSSDAEVQSAVAYVFWLMDRDAKSTALKSLQGKIWETGYRNRKLRGQVYSDVRPAFARWRGQNRSICIFSSGSVQAQKLLFANSTAGDLTPFIRSYFDTTSGPKQDKQSYRRITAALRLEPGKALFLSDVIAELEAARRAGMETTLCVRPGHPAAIESGGALRIVRTFDEVFP